MAKFGWYALVTMHFMNMLTELLHKAAIYKMFGSCHFQALKNDRSVGWHVFHFFYIFNFLYQPSPVENKTRRKEVSGRLCDVFRDLGP